MTEEKQEKKIIIDEDWKAQVEAEKEAAKERETATADQPQASPEGMEMPPASFPLLVTTLATQALASMGQVPDPVEGKAIVRLDVARHFIDTLAVLEEKTKGNLTPEEEQMLGGTLHQLRMAFLAVQNAPATPAEEEKPGA
jgi:hypothetical protein